MAVGELDYGRLRNYSLKAEIREEVRDLVIQALDRLRSSGQLDVPVEFPVAIEVPQDPSHGHFSTNTALRLAGQVGANPREIAAAIIKSIVAEGSWVEGIEIAGPGFINFRLRPHWVYRVLTNVAEARDEYGQSGYGGGTRVHLEFVSANPTGPMVLVQARAGAVGDCLARTMKAAGFDVHTEYYVNDGGNQVLRLARSVEARLRQLLGEDALFPEDGYPGDYVQDIARSILEGDGPGAAVLEWPEEKRLNHLGQAAVDYNLTGQKEQLDRYGVHFDRFFHESELHKGGAVAEVVDFLTERGETYEKEGALWLKSSEYGDDQDRVLVKSDERGSFTYITPDIAYHRDKHSRGFDLIIDILGPDHHGYIGRLKASMECLGLSPDAFEVIIVQLVKLLRGGQPVRMSKRGGEFITLDEVVDEVGVDATRFFVLMRGTDSHLDFDLDLAQLQTNENPVYYVQYAHARICSIIRQWWEEHGRKEAVAEGALDADTAAALSGDSATDIEKMMITLPQASRARLDGLTNRAEVGLIEVLAELPEVVAAAAASRSPHYLTNYAREVATAFHAFYDSCRVLVPERDLRVARLILADATRIVLANVLELLGISQPTRM